MCRTATSKPRVLVVDDNRDAADTTAGLLRLAGCDARVCYDGLSALAEAASFDPTVCLLDLQMPGMDGDALALKLREQCCGRTSRLLVAVTAQSDSASRRRTAAAGFQMHLVKPVQPSDLVAVVGDATGSAPDVPGGVTAGELAAALTAFPADQPVWFGPPGLLTFDRVVRSADGDARILFREVPG